MPRLRPKRFHVHLSDSNTTVSSPLVIHYHNIRSGIVAMAAFHRAALPRLSVTSRSVSLCRHIHSSPFRLAVAHPVTAHGPPPKAPATPELKRTSEPKDTNPTATGTEERQTPKLTDALKKRFWKDVHVHGKTGTPRLRTLIKVQYKFIEIGN